MSTFKYYPAYSGSDPNILAELQRISQAIETLGEGGFQVRHSAPVKPFRGQVAYADGTDWNPGSGEGLYVYDGTNWNAL